MGILQRIGDWLEKPREPRQLRCRPGELAVLIRSGKGKMRGYHLEPLRVGTIVQVVEADIYGKWRLAEPVRFAVRALNAPTIELRGVVTHIVDDLLQPLRDKPGADETLTWAGKPKQVTKPLDAVKA